MVARLMPDLNAALKTIRVPDPAAMMALLGRADSNLRAIEAAVPGADIHVRGDVITVRGEEPESAAAAALIGELLVMVDRGNAILADDVRRVALMLADAAGRDPQVSPSQLLTQSILSAR
ncbi:MAG: hypothetical protein LBL01_02860, partial [Bifidobacteriaceae bacterium]|nr:hypothetical protein [Bifidobacteriaceae bacterium]